MKAYLDILQDILDNGRQRGDRTGTGTLSIFDAQFKHDMREGFPLLTTKRTFLRGVFWELMGFLNNDLHMQRLVDENVKIWDGFRLKEETLIATPVAFDQCLDTLIGDGSQKHRSLDIADNKHWITHKPKIGLPQEQDSPTLPKGALNAPYGAGWRAFQTANGPVDQFAYTLDLLRNNPESRRILVSAWNPGWMPEETHQLELTLSEREALFKRDHFNKFTHWEEMSHYPEIGYDPDHLTMHMDKAGVPTHKTITVTPQDNITNGKPCLTPCHWAFEFYTEEMTLAERWGSDALPLNQKHIEEAQYELAEYANGNEVEYLELQHKHLDDYGVPRRYLSLKWHQRSCDMFLGVPFNIASYALLLQMVASEVGMVPYQLIGDLSNVHIYSNHMDQVKEQLAREPLPLPKVTFKRKPECIEDYVWEDVIVEGYEPHPAIKGDIAV